MTIILNTLQIAVVIILPLVLYLKFYNCDRKKLFNYIIMIYFIWFLSYSFLHELSHLSASYLLGAEIISFNLIPDFFSGDFSNAFVDSRFNNNNQVFFSVLAPYIRNIISVIIYLLFFQKIKNTGIFIKALLFILLILSPTFDIINNYSGFIIFGEGDFQELSKHFGALFPHIIGNCLLLVLILTVFFTRIFQQFKLNR